VNSFEECLGVKGPEQANLDHADLFALLGHQIHGFFGNFSARTHQNDHALRIGRAVVVEQMIGTAGLRGKAVHHRLHNAWNRGMEWVAGLAGLEEHVGILRRAADDGAIGAQGVLPEIDNVLVVHHGADGFVADGQNLAHFVRSAEAVKEMNERNAGFKRGNLRHQSQIGNFLHRVRAQHGPAGGATGHHVGVVAKD